MGGTSNKYVGDRTQSKSRHGDRTVAGLPYVPGTWGRCPRISGSHRVLSAGRRREQSCPVVSYHPERKEHHRQILYPLVDISERRVHHDARTTPRLSLPQGSEIILPPPHDQGPLFHPVVRHIDPDGPNFREARWIVSEDVNVEHLLDVFTTIDENSDDVWVACAGFMEHLYWHKKRLTILKPKIEGLPERLAQAAWARRGELEA
jgi:hypothetical protein